ncbi:MAG: hypothetical protein ACP5D7_22850 [Limnospira sp.]
MGFQWGQRLTGQAIDHLKLQFESLYETLGERSVAIRRELCFLRNLV